MVKWVKWQKPPAVQQNQTTFMREKYVYDDKLCDWMDDDVYV